MTVDFVVSLTEVAKAYRRGGSWARILDGVDLELTPGEIVVLRGRSGSGKTTLLSILAEWVTPDSGRITWSTGVLTRPRPWDRASVIPQTLGLLSELTLGENVALPSRLRGGSTAPNQDLVERLDIAHLLDRPVGGASLGEQQRTAVARALTTRSALILADEPSSHQDPDHLRSVWNALREAADVGSTVLAATHDPEAWSYADRLFDLQEGRLVPGKASHLE